MKPFCFCMLLLLVFVFANGVMSADVRKGHVIPLENKAAKPMAGLLERGKPLVFEGNALETIGMPVNGIGTGQLYVRGDGTLALWQIFNRHVFTGYGLDCYKTYRPASPVNSGFAVWAIQGDKVWKKALNQQFGRVRFHGRYPVATSTYEADDCPLEVAMTVFSPFIPLNAKDSALPVTMFSIEVTNTSDRPVQAKLLGFLENAVLLDSAAAVLAKRRSCIINEKGRSLLVHTAEKMPPPPGGEKKRPAVVLADFEGPDYGDWTVTGKAFGKKPAAGTLPNQQKVSGFLGKGLVNTYLGRDGPQGTLTSPPFKVQRKFINFLVGGGNAKGKTCINLLAEGKVVRTATGKQNERLLWRFWNVSALEGKTVQIQIVDKASGPWGHVNVDHIELSDAPRTGLPENIEDLPDYGSMVLAVPDADGNNNPGVMVFPMTESRLTPLVSRLEALKPGGKATFKAVLAWYFPNHKNGHEYANRFKSASDVAHYAMNNEARLSGDTMAWVKTFYEDGTLPHWLLFRLHSTACNLCTGTCHWWKNGRFWAWEGVGCCPGTCTHVWNYAHSLAWLFPSLERSVREMQDFGEGFDEDSGLVGFRSNRAYAADGQCGTVLKAYREHIMSADDGFLKRNWPAIKKALSYSIAQDGNDDGLIENSQHNTFDINFEGPNTFVGSLYLAALKAGEAMAAEMGDDAFAARCRKISESGGALTVKRLWNGEYFIEEVDLKKHPRHQYAEGCLSDQLFGQGWAHLLTLGYIYPKEHVRKALKSVWTYNWSPDVGPYNALHSPERWFARPGEPGLFTCTWPKSPYLPAGVRYKNEIWTGIEYQVAGHMVWEGMVEEALLICYGIQERYHPIKHNPYNEVECGDHYARALASWGVYNALAGYEYHGPKGHIGFAPKLTPGKFAAAFTAAEGWGLFKQAIKGGAQTNAIDMRWGRLQLRTLLLAVSGKPGAVRASVDGKPLAVKSVLSDGKLLITFEKPLCLIRGQVLSVTL